MALRERFMAAENLKKLHTVLIDTRDAYELALKDTKDPDGCGGLP
jgi:hypothetical protein